MENRDFETIVKELTKGQGPHKHRFLNKVQGLIDMGIISDESQSIVVVHQNDVCSWFNKNGDYCDCNARLFYYSTKEFSTRAVDMPDGTTAYLREIGCARPELN